MVTPKNTAYCFEQILEVAASKTAAHRPLTPISQTIQVRQTRHTGHLLVK